MIIQYLNWLAVAVSPIAYFVLGAVWFNPNVFGKTWMKGHNIGEPTEGDKKGMPKLMAMTFVLCFIGAMVMGYFVYALNSWTWMTGAKIGLIAGCGFTGVGIAMNYMYTKKSLGLIIIDTSYHVVGFMICGIILSMWR